MGFGMNYDTQTGDIVPIIKYDARAGRLFRIDRADGVNTPVDITANFKAVLDLENVEAGFMNFDTGGAPDFVLVPLGEQMPQKPSDKHRQGVRLMLKLSKECAAPGVLADGKGDIREIASVAKAALRGFDELHTLYQAGEKQNPGKLPVVTLKTTLPIQSGSGAQKSTNYQPVFQIVQWVPRPQDLIHKPKARSNGEVAAKPATQATPPATGSTQVSAPVARQAEPAAAEDFG